MKDGNKADGEEKANKVTGMDVPVRARNEDNAIAFQPCPPPPSNDGDGSPLVTKHAYCDVSAK